MDGEELYGPGMCRSTKTAHTVYFPPIPTPSTQAPAGEILPGLQGPAQCEVSS